MRTPIDRYLGRNPPGSRIFPRESTDVDLRKFFAYEREGSREITEAPPHIRLMREQEIADYEPASDPGNLRWYPKGSLMKQLLEQHVSRIVVDYGAMQVETPIMYDYDHPQLSKYLNRLPARQSCSRAMRRSTSSGSPPASVST